MKYISLCSGIEAVTLAWQGLGFEPLAFSEIEAFPSAVLKHYYPNVENLGDMNEIEGKSFADKCDILIGGTPCQAFSVAGERKSLEDDRGKLTLKFCELADDTNATFVIWENVTGVLSTPDNAFGCLLGKLSGNDVELPTPHKGWTGAGYVIGRKRIIAWRILNAQWFGVPQRRKRIFLVACPRDGQADPREILFERKSVYRDFGKSKEKRKRTSKSSRRCPQSPSRNRVISIRANAITSDGGNGKSWSDEDVSFTLTTKDIHCVFYEQPAWGEYKSSDISPTITAQHGRIGHTTPLVYENHAFEARYNEVDICPTIKASQGTGGNNGPLIAHNKSVRRMMPIECERVQGLPDNYTQIPYKGKLAGFCPDTPRYKAIGNSIAVPVLEWLGKRILEEVNKGANQ